MGDIAWFERRPGEHGGPTSVAPLADDPTTLVVGDLRDPDWLRLPPEAGGRDARVVATIRRACPACGGEDRRTWETDCGTRVAECPSCGFVCYRVGS